MRLRLLLPLLLSACTAMPAPTDGDSFATRAQGHWLRPHDATCAAGAVITRQDDRLVITRDGKTTTHRIAEDHALLTRIVDLAPGVTSGIVFTLTPEFFATAETRSFNLVLTQDATGARETWSPCEP